MKKNIVIWFIGSSGSGKTTQARLIHEFLRDEKDPKKIRGVHQYPIINSLDYNDDNKKVYWSIMSPISANLGRWTGKPCCGTDTLSTKAQIIKSFELACFDKQIVIVEGIMATGQWIDFLKTDSTEVIMIHITTTKEVNFQRIKERRATRLGIDPSEVILLPKTQENLLRKIDNFGRLFTRMEDKVDLAFEIDGTKTESSIHLSIIKNIFKFLS